MNERICSRLFLCQQSGRGFQQRLWQDSLSELWHSRRLWSVQHSGLSSRKACIWRWAALRPCVHIAISLAEEALASSDRFINKTCASVLFLLTTIYWNRITTNRNMTGCLRRNVNDDTRAFLKSSENFSSELPRERRRALEKGAGCKVFVLGGCM